MEDRFTETVNSNLILRVPRELSLAGCELADVFFEVSEPCMLRTLHLHGPMSYLRSSIPFILDNLDVFADLDTTYYTATPPFGLDNPMTYCWISTLR